MPLKLDTLTLDGKTVSGQPTLRCYYSHTQFNLGWLDRVARRAIRGLPEPMRSLSRQAQAE